MKDHYRDSLSFPPRLSHHQSVRGRHRYPQQRRKEAPCSPPRGGAWMAKQEEFHEGDRPERLTAPARPPTQSSSHSNLNVTPRPTPRPRHDGLQLQTLLPTAAPQFDNTVGRAGERDGADPAELDAHSEHFPLPLAQGGGTTKWTSPPATEFTSSSGTMRPTRIGTRPTNCVPHHPGG